MSRNINAVNDPVLNSHVKNVKSQSNVLGPLDMNGIIAFVTLVI